MEINDKEVSKVYIDGAHLVIELRYGFEYDILIKHLDNYKGIVGWIAHLSEKNWFSTETLNAMLNILDSHFDGIISEAR